MTRTLMIAASIVIAARSAPAQHPLVVAKTVAQKAASAENAHIAAEQRPDAAQPVAKAPEPPKPAPAPVAVASLSTRTARPQQALTVAGDTSSPPSSIMRETFDYSAGGRRDPFYSLLKTTELRPTLSDLRLTGILYDHSAGRSVATLRDVGTNAQYRVTVGATLGRMRVSIIRLKTIVFTIDEFGSTRQDSLFLGDTTKARVK